MKMLKHVAILWSILVSAGAFECEQHAKVCETSLRIHYELPMMTHEGSVYPHNGKLYHYNVTDTTNAVPVDINKVITADGWENPIRLIVSVNKTLPGPPIIVYEGQTVIVHVHNRLYSETVTVHWHGVDMKDTPWMDGAPYVTQCPIPPGQEFTYKFKANPVGTFWYHSHIGHQRLNGLFGAFIIRKKAPLVMDEHIMQIFEWNHEYGSNTDDLMEEIGDVYLNRQKLPRSDQLERIKYTTYHTNSGLINGRGRYWDSETTHNGAPLETFNVAAGKRYLFRVIGTGALYPWRISVDNHNLTIVGTDGYEIEPVVAESFVITPGERYNFVLEANQVAGNYWVRGETLDRRFMKKAEAILHYEGVSSSEPRSQKRICTSSNKCVVVNCPFPYYPESENVDCVRLTDLRGKLNIHTPHPIEGRYKEYFLNFAFPGENGENGPGSINGRQFLQPTVSALTQPDEITEQCTDQMCPEDGICECVNSLTINSDDIIQMTFLNMGQGRLDDHPVHMHGHAFMVVKVGFGVYNQTNGAFLRDSDDIDCRGNIGTGGSLCTHATWRNSSWLKGNVPDIVQKGALLKDTVIVPSGGYVVVRFPATIPGLWFLHCHIDMHSNDGMAMLLNESFSKIPPPPPGFQQCRNFYGEEDGNGRSKNDDIDEEENNDFNVHLETDEGSYSREVFWVVVATMFGVILVQFAVIILVCGKSRKQSKHDFVGQHNNAFSS